MNKNEQTATMYESIPAVAELNKVPGFNPLKLLRRIISPENGEEMLQLDLRYKKLWFRLANPKGRIRLNALRITEQMAIYEAQVFLERTDENPIGSFTSSCTKEEAPGGQYIQAAQHAAMDEALSDAGFGIQFADVGMDAKGSRYGSRVPLNGISQNEYYPPWEPPVSRFRATRKWYFPPSEPPQHIVAAHIFDFTINLLIVILGELLMQYHQIIYREVFLCLRRQKSEVFWNFWEKI